MSALAGADADADAREVALMLMSKRSGREIEVWMVVGRMAEPPTGCHYCNPQQGNATQKWIAVVSRRVSWDGEDFLV